jgi:hypothetical protein
VSDYEVIYGLMDNLKDHLQDKMVDDIPSVYSSYLEYVDQEGADRVLKPPEIRLGRLQEDPTNLSSSVDIPSAHIAIHPGDPDDRSDMWTHQIAHLGMSNSANLGMTIYPREVGGGTMWWRRFKVEFMSYFIYSNQTQEEAMRLGNLFRVLLERFCESYSSANLHGWQIGGTAFGFGETALHSEIARSFTLERGGPEDDYIWEGAVWPQVLTERL